MYHIHAGNKFLHSDNTHKVASLGQLVDIHGHTNCMLWMNLMANMVVVTLVFPFLQKNHKLINEIVL